MIKVLHIIWSVNFGGIEKLVFDLSVEQQSTGDDCGILIGSSEKGEFFQRFETSGIPCYFLGLSNGYDFNLKKLINAHKTICKYDILHFHSFNPIIAGCGILSRKKIVYTVHSVPGRRKKKRSDFVKERLLKIFLNIFVDFITFNSHFTKKITVKNHVLKKKKLAIVYNGIDFPNRDHQLTSIDNLSSHDFVIGTTSRFAEFKRIDRLIKAFKEFQNKKDTVLVIAGDGSLGNSYKKLVVELGISHKTIFTGFVQNVHAYQNRMDVCVFPSVNEPFGLVAVESLSLGKPVIVFSDGGGLVEIIEDVSNDDIVDSVSELSNRLEYYYNNKELLKADAPIRVEYTKKFSIKTMAESLNTIYYEITSD